MARVFILMLLVGCLSIGRTVGHCTKDDTSCEFYLTVAARMTMWRGLNERVYLNKTDCNPYIYTTNEPVQPEEVILADGSQNTRALMVVNGTLPGPALTVYVNQEITVHVTNHMASATIAIHWHGLSMKGTPWMDGASFITQCPILPGQTFTYKFTVDRVGTHFYHAHSGGAISMGLFGPLIVKEKEEDRYEEHILTIQDYNNRRSNEELAFQAEHGVVFEDGTIFRGFQTPDGVQTTLSYVTSQLINGRGRLFDSDGTALTCTKWHVFEVRQGRSYRFRIINAAFAYQSTLSIDDHSLSVQALDGHEIEPVNADRIYSHSGERFDFILTADKPVGNYWMRLDSVVPGRFPAYAILRYIGAASEDPTTQTKECTSDSKCIWLNCPFESYGNVVCLNVDDLKAADMTSSAPSATGQFREIFLAVGYGLLNGAVAGQINGKSFQLPTISAMTQPQQVTNQCTEERGCGIEKVCRCVSSLDIQLGDVIQLNLLNVGFLSIVHHPMHTHGYNFHVLKIGHRPTNDSFAHFGPSPDVNCNSNSSVPLVCNNASWSDPSWAGGNIPGIDLARAPLKDTLTIPAGGYAVVRFVVDNPGLWFLHCHQEWHVNIFGMGILLNDSFADIPRPPRGFPKCGNFNPTQEMPDDGGEDTTSTTRPSTTCPSSECDKDLKFTGEEFWATLGVLLFVIVLQFIIAVICLSRKGSVSKYNM